MKRRKHGTGCLSKNGRYWRMIYTVDRKVHRESTHTEDKEEAEAILAARLCEIGRISSNVATLRTDGLTSTIGAAAELLVAADLLSHGIEVFRALNIHCSCDLIAHWQGKLARVEVKTGKLDWQGKPTLISRHRERHDILAVVDRRSGVHYFPPIDEFLGRANQKRA